MADLVMGRTPAIEWENLSLSRYGKVRQSRRCGASTLPPGLPAA